LDKLAAASIELLDEGGEKNLTIRRLAERLDVAAMAIYWYVSDRAELMAVIRDAAFGPVIDHLELDAGWEATLRSFALSLRQEVVIAHPDLAAIAGDDRHVAGPNVLTLIDRVLAALLDDGFAIRDATWALRMVTDLALNQPAEVRVSGLETVVEQGIDGLPTLTAVMHEYAERPDPTDGFERTLDAAVTGIRAALQEQGP
jgi:AcrR family transcriptional regulator